MRGDDLEAGILQQQRIAVGLGAGNRLGGDAAGSARLVLDDHALSQRGAQGLGDEASGDVGGAAGRGGHDQRHGTIGKIRLRVGSARGGQAQRDGAGA